MASGSADGSRPRAIWTPEEGILLLNLLTKYEITSVKPMEGPAAKLHRQQAWERLRDEFNGHPCTTTQRDIPALTKKMYNLKARGNAQVLTMDSPSDDLNLPTPPETPQITHVEISRKRKRMNSNPTKKQRQLLDLDLENAKLKHTKLNLQVQVLRTREKEYEEETTKRQLEIELMREQKKSLQLQNDVLEKKKMLLEVKTQYFSKMNGCN